MATQFKTARLLASIAVVLGWVVVGFGLISLAMSVANARPGGFTAVYPILFGFYSVLFGWLCRAAFDIADRPSQGSRRDA